MTHFLSASHPHTHLNTRMPARTHARAPKIKSLKCTHHRGREHIHCETKNPELQSYSGTPTRAGTCDIHTHQGTKTLSFYRRFFIQVFCAISKCQVATKTLLFRFEEVVTRQAPTKQLWNDGRDGRTERIRGRTEEKSWLPVNIPAVLSVK